LDGAQGGDEAPREAQPGDREVLDRPGRLCAVVGVRGHHHLAHAVALDTGLGHGSSRGERRSPITLASKGKAAGSGGETSGGRGPGGSFLPTGGYFGGWLGTGRSGRHPVPGTRRRSSHTPPAPLPRCVDGGLVRTLRVASGVTDPGGAEEEQHPERTAHEKPLLTPPFARSRVATDARLLLMVGPWKHDVK